MNEFFQRNLPYFIAGGVVLLAVLVGISAAALRRRKIKKLGLEGEKKVAHALRKFARFRSYRVINDLYLPLYDKTTQIDHILIGFFGILVLETKNLAGEIYGDPRNKDWTQIVGGKKHTFYNPLMQNQAHIDCIRHLLGKENLYSVPIESLVVFTKRKAQLYIPHNLPIIYYKKLKRFLHQARFEEDKGFDVEKHVEALLKYRVTDPKLLAAHNKNVKIMAKNRK